jgi:hypothetical protein
VSRADIGAYDEAILLLLALHPWTRATIMSRAEQDAGIEGEDTCRTSDGLLAEAIKTLKTAIMMPALLESDEAQRLGVDAISHSRMIFDPPFAGLKRCHACDRIACLLVVHFHTVATINTLKACDCMLTMNSVDTPMASPNTEGIRLYSMPRCAQKSLSETSTVVNGWCAQPIGSSRNVAKRAGERTENDHLEHYYHGTQPERTGSCVGTVHTVQRGRGTVLVFRQGVLLEDVIGSYAYSLLLSWSAPVVVCVLEALAGM